MLVPQIHAGGEPLTIIIAYYGGTARLYIETSNTPNGRRGHMGSQFNTRKTDKRLGAISQVIVAFGSIDSRDLVHDVLKKGHG